MRLEVRVVPRSKKPGIIEESGKVLEVRVSAIAERGKANAEAAKRLAGHFRLPLSSVILIKGAKARRKVFLIKGVKN